MHLQIGMAGRASPKHLVHGCFRQRYRNKFWRGTGFVECCWLENDQETPLALAPGWILQKAQDDGGMLDYGKKTSLHFQDWQCYSQRQAPGAKCDGRSRRKRVAYLGERHHLCQAGVPAPEAKQVAQEAGWPCEAPLATGGFAAGDHEQDSLAEAWCFLLCWRCCAGGKCWIFEMGLWKDSLALGLCWTMLRFDVFVFFAGSWRKFCYLARRCWRQRNLSSSHARYSNTSRVQFKCWQSHHFDPVALEVKKCLNLHWKAITG